MTNRREFLKATTLPVIVGAAGVVDTTRASALPLLADLHSVIIDSRHAEARRLGSQLANAGATIHAIPDGDVTQVWLSQIGPAWRREPLAVAGLTARPALFCLEQLALACGLRVVFHGEHVVHPGGRTEHSILRGAEHAHLSLRDLRMAGPLWPARIADVIANHREQAGSMRFGRSEAALEPSVPAGAQLLTSWIIAGV
jgi:hypothetical protein